MREMLSSVNSLLFYQECRKSHSPLRLRAPCMTFHCEMVDMRRCDLAIVGRVGVSEGKHLTLLLLSAKHDPLVTKWSLRCLVA